MPTGLLKDIIDRKPDNIRLIAMDISKNNIGLALSDAEQSIATPLKTIKRTKFTKDIQHLKAVIDDYSIGGYILGYPVNMDGSEGPRCESIRHFADEMANHPDIFGDNPWIALWDERLSTVTAEGIVDDFIGKRKTRVSAKDSGIIDALAAQHILQGALDFIQVGATGSDMP